MSSSASKDLSPLRSVASGTRPRFFYGWVMLPVATAGLIATSPAQTFGFAPFNPSLREAMGLSHSALTGAYMLGTLLAAIPLTYVGAAMDRFGARRTMTVVVFLMGLTCIGMSQVQGLVSLFVAFLLLRMLGPGALGLVAGNTLALWFSRRLGTVAGLRSMGMAVAIGVFPGLAFWLIHAFGWRWAYALLGLGVWAVMFPVLAFVFRNRPEDIGQSPDGLPPAPPSPADPESLTAAEPQLTLAEAMATRAYWILQAGMGLWSMLVTGVTFNIVPLFTAQGLTATDASRMFTVFGAVLAGAQLLGGLLADRVRLRLLFSVAMAGLALSMGLLRFLSVPGVVLAYAASAGISQGLVSATNSTVWARYYGRLHLGRINGSVMTM
ncbi:MAG: MFS transporter, partial [Phycisphaerae bacterium]|nr:MFS transporter [Phycisphaerae bacterium]